MSKAIVLLSGGQDSTTALYWALQNFDYVEAVSFDYGQRHGAELSAAMKIFDLVLDEGRIDRHWRLDIPALFELNDSALVRHRAGPEGASDVAASGGYGDREAAGGLPTSFVPGRNLLMLSLAAARAVKSGIHSIVTGVCQTDYSGYPDCRREFIDSLERTLGLAMPSSCGPFRILTPLMHLTKAETVRLARRLPGCWKALALTVTCYEGKRPGCGACPACELRAKGFAEAGEVDPAETAV